MSADSGIAAKTESITITITSHLVVHFETHSNAQRELLCNLEIYICYVSLAFFPSASRMIELPKPTTPSYFSSLPAPIPRLRSSELQSHLVEGGHGVIGSLQAKIERGGPGNQRLRSDKWAQPSVTGEAPSLQAHTNVEGLCMFGWYGCHTVKRPVAPYIGPVISRALQRCFSSTSNGRESWIIHVSKG